MKGDDDLSPPFSPPPPELLCVGELVMEDRVVSQESLLDGEWFRGWVFVPWWGL